MLRSKILAFFCLFYAISGNAQSFKQKDYFIKGTIKGIDSGTIRMSDSNGSNVLDSSTILNGKFSMKGSISLPERMLFNISPGNWNFRAFIEDTIITLLIDTAGAEHYGNGESGSGKWALIWEIEEHGTILSKVYKKFKSETSQKYYIELITALREKLKALKGDAAGEARCNREIDSLSMVALTKQRIWIEKYISQNPSSIGGVFLFSEFYHSSFDVSLSYLHAILKKFSGTATCSVYFKELYDTYNKLRNSEAKATVSDFTLLQRDSSTFSISSTRGNYVMIDFWASWCVPCRKAIPNWKKLFAQYKNNGFVIVSLSNDRNWDEWIKALDKEKMPWVQVIDNFPNKNEPAVVSELFGIKAFPYYVLIDKEGKIILSTNDEGIMQSKIGEILK